MDLSNITIENSYIQEILAIAGYPLLTLADSDFELTEDQIKSLVVLPTLREYYRWFPIPTNDEYSIAGSFSIDFPTSTTFQVMDARLNTVGNYTTNLNGNAFINARNYRKSSTYGPNMWGTGNSYNMENAYILRSATNQTYVDKYKAFKVSVNLTTRKLEGYSNTSGKMSVVWGSFSNDFGDIPFTRLEHVIKLSQSKLLEILLQIRANTNNDLPNAWNIDFYEDKRSALREEVLNKWMKETKVVITKS